MKRLSYILCLLLLLGAAHAQTGSTTTMTGTVTSTGNVKTRYVGTDYASCGFETDFCQFQVNSNGVDPVISTTVAHSGTKSAKAQVDPATSLSELVWLARNVAPYNHTGPANPALTEPAGLSFEFYFLMPQASIDHLKVGDRQSKLNRTRMNFDAPNGGWVSCFFGPNGGHGPPHDQWISFNETGDPTTGWTYQINSGGDSGIILTGDTWHHFVGNIKRTSSTTGRARGWLNGTLLYDTGNQTYLGLGATTDEQSLQFGHIVSGAGRTESVFIYLDDLKVTTSDISP